MLRKALYSCHVAWPQHEGVRLQFPQFRQGQDAEAQRDACMLPAIRMGCTNDTRSAGFYSSGDMLWGRKGGFPDAAVSTVGETALNCAHSGGLH